MFLLINRGLMFTGMNLHVHSVRLESSCEMTAKGFVSSTYTYGVLMMLPIS